MTKKKPGKHLQFYMDCIEEKIMPDSGLCGSSWERRIDGKLLLLFKPEGVSTFDYWASGKKHDNCYYIFTELRQTIVLLMACLNNEL